MMHKMHNKKMEEAMEHPNKLGEGAKKRKKLHGQEKVHVVMSEFKRGTLHSGSGEIVKDRDQAIAIAMSGAGMSKKSRKGSGVFTQEDLTKGYKKV